MNDQPTTLPQSGGPLDEHGTTSDPWTVLDWVLVITGGVAFLFLLMFATTGLTSALRVQRKRRKLLAICLITELAVIAGIVALVLA